MVYTSKLFNKHVFVYIRAHHTLIQCAINRSLAFYTPITLFTDELSCTMHVPAAVSSTKPVHTAVLQIRLRHEPKCQGHTVQLDGTSILVACSPLCQ